MCRTDLGRPATEAIIAQLERFAPGFRDRIIGKTVRHYAMSDYNPNYVGGDIMTAPRTCANMTFGPGSTLSPYKIGGAGHVHLLGGHPAGTGAHGMCGANAAQVALAQLNTEVQTHNPSKELQ